MEHDDARNNDVPNDQARNNIVRNDDARNNDIKNANEKLDEKIWGDNLLKKARKANNVS